MTKAEEEDLTRRVEEGVAKVLGREVQRELRRYYLQANESVMLDNGMSYVNSYGRPITITITGE